MWSSEIRMIKSKDELLNKSDQQIIKMTNEKIDDNKNKTKESNLIYSTEFKCNKRKSVKVNF